jgi:hypothetical protein
MGVLGLLTGKFTAGLITILAAIILIGGVWTYTGHLKGQRDRLADQTRVLEERIRERDQTIAVIEQDRATYEARTRAVMAELSRYQSSVARNADTARADYDGIVSNSRDVSVLEAHANAGWKRLFEELETMSRG